MYVPVYVYVGSVLGYTVFIIVYLFVQFVFMVLLWT